MHTSEVAKSLTSRRINVEEKTILGILETKSSVSAVNVSAVAMKHHCCMICPPTVAAAVLRYSSSVRGFNPL